MSGIYWKYHGLKLSVGNLKLGKNTIILNMGPAYACPSRLLGHCKLAKHCYAAKAERLYPSVKTYRARQQEYWLDSSRHTILNDMTMVLTKAKRYQRVKYLRYNESGDFCDQNCVDKLAYIAKQLKSRFSITTYGYTARPDLDYSFLAKHAVVRGSGHTTAPHGMTTAKRLTAEQKAKTHLTIGNTRFAVCPMDCRTCNRCKTRRQMNIVFPLH